MFCEDEAVFSSESSAGLRESQCFSFFTHHGWTFQILKLFGHFNINNLQIETECPPFLFLPEKKNLCSYNNKIMMNAFWLWMPSCIWVIWGPISNDAKLLQLWAWRALHSEKRGAPQCGSVATYQYRCMEIILYMFSLIVRTRKASNRNTTQQRKWNSDSRSITVHQSVYCDPNNYHPDGSGLCQHLLLLLRALTYLRSPTTTKTVMKTAVKTNENYFFFLLIRSLFPAYF